MKYIGTKVVEAEPMTMGDASRKGLLQANRRVVENQPGYYVKYNDGYESWSSKEAFDKAYRCAGNHIDRLRIELDELTGRLKKLYDFLDSPKFQELPKKKRSLLYAQYGVMRAYRRVLVERLDEEEKA